MRRDDLKGKANYFALPVADKEQLQQLCGIFRSKDCFPVRIFQPWCGIGCIFGEPLLKCVRRYGIIAMLAEVQKRIFHKKSSALAERSSEVAGFCVCRLPAYLTA